MSEQFRIRVTVRGPAGDEDEAAVVTLTDSGVTIDSEMHGMLELPWETLKQIVEHPYAEEQLLLVQLE